ncbi:MAG TPA: hypothetical protein VGL05_24435, partial [Kribbella sp.]
MTGEVEPALSYVDVVQASERRLLRLGVMLTGNDHTAEDHRSCLVIQRLLRGTRHGTSPHGTEGHDAPHRDLRPRAPSYRTEHLLAT